MMEENSATVYHTTKKTKKFECTMHVSVVTFCASTIKTRPLFCIPLILASKVIGDT